MRELAAIHVVLVKRMERIKKFPRERQIMGIVLNMKIKRLVKFFSTIYTKKSVHYNGNTDTCSEVWSSFHVLDCRNRGTN